jgi:serine/threonine protein kinase/photosystem II stability/assembly factor-like uncharacterized protein
MLEQLIGQNLGEFKVISLLGEGGMGAVFKGYDITLQRDVAIKVMHPHIARQTNFQERFLQEARTTARLDHPCIVQIYHFGSARSLLYIVMKFIPGANLERMLRDLKAQSKWIPLSEAMQIIRQVALALDYAHQQGVLHRDIKPSNIMIEPVSSDGLPFRPVITDLGLAKLAEGGVATSDGVSMGTPAYMSPEQAMGKAVDARSDIYSLGVLLFELSTGQLPFPIKNLTEAVYYHTTQPPPTPRSIRPDLPEELEKVILKAMEKDPAQRLPSAGVLAKMVDDLHLQAAVTEVPTALQSTVSLITEYQKSLVEARGPSVMEEFKTPPGSSQDYIQVLSGGKTESVALKTERLKIGRDKDNDIILDDPKISRHHVQIDFDGSNYSVIDLNSSNGSYLSRIRLLPGIPEIWTTDKVLQLGDACLRLVRSQPGSQIVPGTIPGTAMGSRVDASRIQTSPGEGRVGLYIDLPQIAVDPGQSVNLAVVVINQGSLVDQFNIAVSGIPKPWIKDGTRPVQLMPGDQQEVNLCIQPPRSSQSKAGRYSLTVAVTSRDDPSQVAQAKTTLTVSAYSQFNSELYPEKIRAGQTGRITIHNQGNVKEIFKVSWKDRGDELIFKSNQGQLNIAEGEQDAAEFQATPRQRRWIGGEMSHSFTAQVSSSKGIPQYLSGEVISRGLIPVWVLPVVITFCVLLVGSLAVLPPIIFPTPAPTLIAAASSTPEPGMPILEEWCIYPDGFEPKAFNDCPIQVKAASGQKLIIRWRASNAQKVEISPLGDQSLFGQVPYEVLESKTITLKATNANKVTQKSIDVIVVNPTPTETSTPMPLETSTPTPTETGMPTPTETSTPTPTSTPITGPVAKITAFNMVDLQTGWAEWVDPFGVAANLLHTMDGGGTWQDVTPPGGYPIGSRFFVLDGQHAWAALRGVTTGQSGQAGAVWRTVDGGLSWQVSAPVQPHMQGYNVLPDFSPQALYFLDEQYGWLVVSIDHNMSQDVLAILATTDGGRTWEQVADKFSMGQSPEGTQGYDNMPCHVSGIAFTDPQKGYLAGDCLGPAGDYGFTILDTGDGGHNWLAAFTNPVNLPQALQAAMSEGRSVCGATGVENTPAGILVQHTCVVQESSGQSNYYYLSLLPKGSNAWIGWAGETASFASLSEGYSLGQMMKDGKRSLSATTDGGRTWQTVRSTTWQQARLDFPVPGQGFALVLKWGNQTYDSALVRTEDGGSNWVLVEGVLK